MGKREKNIEEIELELRESGFTLEEVVNLSAADAKRCTYYPEIAALFNNNIHLAIFVTQVKHWWDFKGRKPFYKYNTPAESSNGDSWMEALAFSKDTLASVKKLCCTRVRGRASAEELATTGRSIKTLVVCYQDDDGLTHWYLNEIMFTNLRNLALEKSGAVSSIPEMAISGNSGNGRLRNSRLSSSTSNVQVTTIEEKENYKEKETEVEEEEDLESKFEVEAQPVSKKPATENKRKKTKEKANKETTPKTAEQMAIIENETKGHTLPLDFLPDSVTMDKLAEDGYLRDELLTEAQSMINWFQMKNPEAKMVNWSIYFETKWVPQSKTLKKNGKILNKDANTQRAERLRELAGSRVRDRVGATSLSELANRLRGRGN